jgi:RNA polymerase sigma factor (sigma-70 family)
VGMGGATQPGSERLRVDAIYREHGHVVLRRATRLLGSEDEGREALQELFASLVERPEQFSHKSAITTWLYSATTHLCLNRLRDKRTRARLLEERGRALEPGAPPGADHALLVRQLLSSLPAELATAAVYYYVDEMTHEEIARVLGCSRRHVGNLLERLRDTAMEGESCSAP